MHTTLDLATGKRQLSISALAAISAGLELEMSALIMTVEERLTAAREIQEKSTGGAADDQEAEAGARSDHDQPAD